MDNGNSLILAEKHELIEAIKSLEAKKKELEKNEKAMREELLKAMQDYGVWGINTGGLAITRVPEGVRESLDGERLRELYPDIAEECVRVRPVGEYLRFKVRGEGDA